MFNCCDIKTLSPSFWHHRLSHLPSTLAHHLTEERSLLGCGFGLMAQFLVRFHSCRIVQEDFQRCLPCKYSVWKLLRWTRYLPPPSVFQSDCIRCDLVSELLFGQSHHSVSTFVNAFTLWCWQPNHQPSYFIGNIGSIKQNFICFWAKRIVALAPHHPITVWPQ